MTLTVQVDGFSNSWDIWVYNAIKKAIQDENKIRIVQELDKKTIKYLVKGGKVILSPVKGSLRAEKGGEIGVGFSSIFWNTAWTGGQKPHT